MLARKAKSEGMNAAGIGLQAAASDGQLKAAAATNSGLISAADALATQVHTEYGIAELVTLELAR